jgi:hypothetical protein
MCSIMLGGFTCDHSALPEKEVDFRPHHRKVLWVNSQPKRGTRPQAEASKISAEMPFLREPPGQLSKFQHPAAHLTHAHGLSLSRSPSRHHIDLSLSLSFPSSSRFPPPAQPAQTLAR